MNMLTQGNFNINEVTMSSPDIVGFINNFRKETATVEKPYKELRHDDFMRKVLSVLGEEHAPKFIGTQNYGNNNTRHIYNFPKREACLMAMSYSYELQARVFDRMTAMEEALKAKNSFDITNPTHLIQAIEVQAKLNIELSEKVAVLEPKANALDQIAETSSSFCIRDAAKTVGVPEKKFIQFLMNQNWIYRAKDGSNTLCAYSKRLAQKVMIEKVTRVIETSKGPQVFTQARITSKGLTRLAAMVRDAGLVEGVAA